MYVYKSGVFDQLRLVSDSFSEFANSFFTVDEEEEYQEFIEKMYVLFLLLSFFFFLKK